MSTLGTSFNYRNTRTVPGLGMMGVSETALTETQLREATPSIFAGDKHGSRSGRYTFIPTYEVVKGLAAEGFQPRFACEAKARDESKFGYTKHMIRFRQEGAKAFVDGSFAELVLINSHDGSSAYHFKAGVYRAICANGLVCGSSFKTLKSRHSGNVVDDALAMAFETARFFPTVNANMVEMRDIHLNSDDRELLANVSLLARYNPEGDPDVNVPVQAFQVLTPRRHEDRSPDLYTTYNVIQENLIRGGLRYVSRNEETGKARRLTTREQKGIDTNVSLNQKLWDLASDMATRQGKPLTVPALAA